MDVFCGIDWAEGHHDVALADDTGKLPAECRINDDLDVYRLLLDLLAEHGDTAETPIPVTIETSRGLLVATLREGPRKIYVVNPLAASRYRDRHGNRMFGQLRHCLLARIPFNESIAFPAEPLPAGATST